MSELLEGLGSQGSPRSRSAGAQGSSAGQRAGHTSFPVVVVGGGVGGLVSAIRLATQGLRPLVLERSSVLGGKAGRVQLEGRSFDTGPSVLTLPSVFEELFEAAGRRLSDYLVLRRPEPCFRYHYVSSPPLLVHQELEHTFAEVQALWGVGPRLELETYLRKAARIWEHAAPEFVFGEAPSWARLLEKSFSQLFSQIQQIDVARSLLQAIRETVGLQELRYLLMRYATYNGSDVRAAPATLGCISHVELGLGTFAIEGGMRKLVDALETLLLELGGTIECDCEVTGLELAGRRVCAVETKKLGRLPVQALVLNADLGSLRSGLLPAEHLRHLPAPQAASMSAYNFILRAPRVESSDWAAHEVMFPANYEQEFADIFDHGRVPRDPCFYFCAIEASEGQGRAPLGPATDSGVHHLFAMANAPALDSPAQLEDEEVTLARLQLQLQERLSLHKGFEHCELLWSRGPSALALAHPGSRGAIYGPSSNSRWAAFRRAPNRLAEFPGLFLASGSAHPGGGLPMVARSGWAAASQLMAELNFAGGGQ